MAFTDPRPILEWHLFHNHYPPPHRLILPFALRAIEVYPDDPLSFLTVEPEPGVLTTLEQEGVPVTAAELVKQFHLEAFIDDGEEHDA